MKKMLITGGTVFVSRYAAEYFSKQYDVYVLNRNTKPQCSGVTLLEADRHDLSGKLRNFHFDVVLDITAYNKQDIEDLLNGLGSFDDYIFISSSAVYPETNPQPFAEEGNTSVNQYWGGYGTNKIEAEKVLLSRVPKAYILRPPYLYGPMNNVYREAFVFDCARQAMPFYLPGKGSMKLQFFHIRDLCRFIEIILLEHPEQHTFNVGNAESVSIKQWATICYEAAKCSVSFVEVSKKIEQRQYFPFYDYEYALDVSKMKMYMKDTIDLRQGIQECYDWYIKNENMVIKKPYLSFIEQNLR